MNSTSSSSSSSSTFTHRNVVSILLLTKWEKDERMPSHDRWKLSAPGWWCEMIYKVTSSLYPRRTMRTWPGWTSVGPVQLKENSTAWWPRLSSKLFEWWWESKKRKENKEKKERKIMRLEKNYPIKNIRFKSYYYSVWTLTSGALPAAFCTTRNILVTSSMTWQVCRTRSPFHLFPTEGERTDDSDDCWKCKQPVWRFGTLGDVQSWN